MTDRRSLAQLLALRAMLDPGEVVTLLVPLARDLAEAHAAGRVYGAIDAADVVLGADGRATFASVAVEAAALEPLDDVRALAALGWLALTARPVDRPGAPPDTTPAALVDALLSAVFDDDGKCPDAGEFADAVLRSCPAAPIRGALSSRPPAAPPSPARTVASVRPRVWLVAGGVAALALAVFAGTAWGRHGGEPAAAPVGSERSAVEPTASPPLTSPTARSRPARADWTATVNAIEAARAAAYVRGDLHRLHALYAPDSAVGVRDAAMLRGLLARQLRVRDLRARVFSVRVLASTDASARCRVVDAMSSYVVVDRRGVVVRRSDATRKSAESMRLARVAGRWRIVDVKPAR